MQVRDYNYMLGCRRLRICTLTRRCRSNSEYKGEKCRELFKTFLKSCLKYESNELKIKNDRIKK